MTDLKPRDGRPWAFTEERRVRTSARRQPHQADAAGLQHVTPRRFSDVAKPFWSPHWWGDYTRKEYSAQAASEAQQEFTVAAPTPEYGLP